MSAWVIYAIGVFLLGLAYPVLDRSMSTPTFIGVVLAYLVLLRFVAVRLGKKNDGKPLADWRPSVRHARLSTPSGALSGEPTSS